MLAIHKITIDVTNPVKRTVWAVRGDCNTRAVAVTLTAEGEPWVLPPLSAVLVGYQKPDATAGLYDLLPEGTPAWSQEDNVLTVLLAPQMLTVAGTVEVNLTLVAGEKILQTFCFSLQVAENLEAPDVESQNYVNWMRLIKDELDARVEATLTQAKESGDFDGETGRTPGIWLLPRISAEIFMAQGCLMSQLVGVQEPSAQTIQVGDLVICTGGDVCFVSQILEGSSHVIGTNGTQENDPAEGARLCIKGDMGADGADGEDGLDGMDGVDGADGAVFIPSVDADGMLSWTNTGGLANPAPVNIRGPKGDPGGADTTMIVTEANWEASEGEAGYIQNRPFCDLEPLEYPVLPEMTLSFTDGEASGTGTVPVIPGETYIACWDRAVFACTAWEEYPDGETRYTGLGNRAYLGLEEENQVPFLLLNDLAAGTYRVTATSGDSHTISIFRRQPVQKRLDPKYLDAQWTAQKVYEEETVLLDTTIAFTSYRKSVAMNGYAVTEGKQYRIWWNGFAYDCVAVMPGNMAVLGNLFLVDKTQANTGEPFCITAGATTVVVKYLNMAENVSIRIAELRVECSPLPEEFLPVMGGVCLRSATAGSTRQYYLTVDDSGTISATRIA